MSQVAQQISGTNLSTRLALDEPDGELRDLTQSFNSMLNRLDHAFAQQGKFVADAAHELRTPLATMRAELEVISTCPDPIPPDYQDLAASCARQVTRLERLITDLRLLAMGEVIPLHDTVMLGSLLDEVVLQLQGKAAMCGVTLELVGDELEEPVCGNGLLLARVFSNLVENSLQYTQRGGAVTLAARAADEGMAVTVADTGIGIAPEERPFIFDHFYRCHHARERHPIGSGLGLALVAEIVRRHGGHVDVESCSGRGSAFTVWLPR